MSANLNYFNKLNDDVIHEIFAFLDAESIKVAAEVCKKWNTLICERKSLLSKLKFVFPEDWKECEPQIRNMTQKFSTIEFRIKVNDPVIYEILEEIDLPIEMLVLNGATILDHIFRKLLKIFKYLDKLIINESSLIVENNAEDNNLLMINNADSIDHNFSVDHPMKVMSLIAISKLDGVFIEELVKMRYQSRKFALKTGHQYLDNYDILKLKIFLKMQKNLSELIIETAIDVPILIFFTEQLSSTKLKKLVVIFGGYSEESHDALAEFIKSQSTLEEIEIRRCFTISENVFKAIYETKNLNKLILDVEDLPFTIRAPVPRVPHLNLKTLITDFKNIPIELLEILMKMFANIETFGFKKRIPERFSSDIIRLTSIHLKSIKLLKLPCLFVNAVDTIPSLKKLHVVRVSLAKLRNFVRHNVSLHDLKVEKIIDLQYYGDFDFVYTFEDLVNLKNLSVEYAPVDKNDVQIVIDEAVLHFLRQNSPHFSVLKVGGSISVADNIKDHSSIKVIEFDNNLSKKRMDTFDEVLKSFDDDEELKCLSWKNNNEDDEVELDHEDNMSDGYNEYYDDDSDDSDSDDVERVQDGLHPDFLLDFFRRAEYE